MHVDMQLVIMNKKEKRRGFAPATSVYLYVILNRFQYWMVVFFRQ